MALDGVTSFLRLKYVTITCKSMRRSLRIGGSSSVQWRKVGRSWGLRMCFRRLLCVRIEVDQLQCVNCWVIIHSLSVSCTTINHSRCALVIWSSLQLTSKQWIITQQFTAGADLFLKHMDTLNHYCLMSFPSLSYGGIDFEFETCWVVIYNFIQISKNTRGLLMYINWMLEFYWLKEIYLTIFQHIVIQNQVNRKLF